MPYNIGPIELVIVLVMLGLPVLLLVLLVIALRNRSTAASRNDTWPQQEAAPPAAPIPLADRLAQLEQARAAGQVTDDEYAALREKILGEA